MKYYQDKWWESGCICFYSPELAHTFNHRPCGCACYQFTANSVFIKFAGFDSTLCSQCRGTEGGGFAVFGLLSTCVTWFTWLASFSFARCKLTPSICVIIGKMIDVLDLYWIHFVGNWFPQCIADWMQLYRTVGWSACRSACQKPLLIH